MQFNLLQMFVFLIVSSVQQSIFIILVALQFIDMEIGNNIYIYFFYNMEIVFWALLTDYIGLY